MRRHADHAPLLLRGPRPRRRRLLVIQNLTPTASTSASGSRPRVDLNRYSRREWDRPRPAGDPEYAGPRPLSEPETRLRPCRSPAAIAPTCRCGSTSRSRGPRVGPSVPRRAGTRGRRDAVPAHPLADRTASNWQNHAYPSRASFVVELPAGPLGHERPHGVTRTRSRPAAPHPADLEEGRALRSSASRRRSSVVSARWQAASSSSARRARQVQQVLHGVDAVDARGPRTRSRMRRSTRPRRGEKTMPRSALTSTWPLAHRPRGR